VNPFIQQFRACATGFSLAHGGVRPMMSRLPVMLVMFSGQFRFWPLEKARNLDFLVELRGFEPVTSAMRHPRALGGVPLPTATALLRSCANTGAGTIDRTP
jgi:hypothetical protein